VVVDLPPPVQMQALEEGTIDVALMGEPFVTMAVGAGYGVIWMPLEQVVPDFQHAATLYGPGLLDNPDAGNRFMVAYLKAVRQYNEGLTERNLELMAEFSGLDQALLEGICLPPIRDNGQINADTILDYQEWAVGQGYLDRVVEEDEFWDPAFVEYASQVLDSGSQ
jgi:NitT/TauT family transport system substrate-binding protein